MEGLEVGGGELEEGKRIEGHGEVRRKRRGGEEEAERR